MKMRVLVTLFAVAMLAVPAANADSWTGSGAGPYSGGPVDYWYFTLSTASNTTITTNDAYTNMDTVLGLWDGSGNFLALNDDDGVSAPCGNDPNTWCSTINTTLGPGLYYVGVSRFPDFPNGGSIDPSDIFNNIGYYCGSPNSDGCHGFNEGDHYLLTVSNTDAVPEPASLALLGTGIAGWVARRRMLA